VQVEDRMPRVCDLAREIDDDDLGTMIENLAGKVADTRHAIFNLHVPPVDSTLDTCPMLDWNTDPPTQIVKAGQVVLHGAGSEAVRNLRLPTRAGTLVPATSVALLEEQAAPQPVYRKDLKPVVYVTGDVARELESPAYAMLAMEDRLAAAGIPTTWAGPAELTEQVSLNWDGEWRITYEVFRDLGIAFAAVLVLIYLLVVAWFQSYLTPLVIMAPIPLTLAGILPAHWLSGAFFTATSMIGMIALAGIIVRNSILLVDFIELARARGTAVSEAVVEAGLVRARPILLTAAAVVVGGVVMVGDPIFQGLGIAMISGALVATLLTLVVIPLLYADLVGGSRPTGGATL